MTRIVFLSALTALVGCKKDDCEDTGNTGACDTGAVEDSADDVVDDDPPATADSCTIGNVCIEANEPDNEAWCNGLPDNYGAVYAATPCPDGATNICTDMGAVGDYNTAGATAYYYEGNDGSSACADAEGTYQ